MDPIIILPIALGLAWAATRKKKTTKKPTKTEPELPSVHDDPFGPFDDPEPWRPGGPELPPPPYDGPVGPKPFPGPSGGPKSPEFEDPSPTEIYPGTTTEQIEAHENAAYGLFISSDCETVFEGERWWDEVFMPRARALVLEQPDAYHHPSAVLYELLVMPPQEGHETETPAQSCVAAWSEFVYGAFTPASTFSGWIDDPHDEYWDYTDWFGEEYPSLSEFLWAAHSNLWSEPDLAAVFDRDWPQDVLEDDGDIDFDPTGS